MYVGAADGSTYNYVYFGDGTATPVILTASAGKTATILFGGNVSNLLYNYTAGAALTFGPAVMVHGSYGGIADAYGTGSFINQGMINADVAGGEITVSSPALTNTGTMTASNGGVLDLEGNWSNSGTITANASPVYLGGNFTFASLGTLNSVGNGGIDLTGVLDLTGQTLTLNASTGPWHLKGGTIKNGTLSAGTKAGGGSYLLATNSGGTLDGVTVNGDIDLSPVYGGYLRVLNTLTLNGTLYVGAADGSTYNYVYFGDGSGTPVTLTASLNNRATILFGANSNNLLYNLAGNVSVTFGPLVTVHGSYGQLVNLYSGGSFVNQGMINADVAGVISITAQLINTGTMSATAGILTVYSPLAINSPGVLNSSRFGNIVFAANLLGTTTAVAASNPKGVTTFSGGGPGAPLLLEAMSKDLGADVAGLENNFAFGTLVLDANSNVQLVNQAQNSSGAAADAVYARSLFIPAGATLDLNGVTLYAQNVQVAGNVINGAISQLPTAISVWRLGNFDISTDTGIAADTATPDNDGVMNLLKYGLVIPVGSSSQNLLPVVQLVSYVDGDHLTVTFSQNLNNNDITIQVQAADNPAGPWSPVATSINGSLFTGSGFLSEVESGEDLVTVQVRDPVSVSSATDRYLKITVTH
jgi:hypothetical protein